mgnify:CR=1 FL=1
MIIKIFSNSKVIVYGEFVSMNKGSLSFIEENEHKTISGLNWGNITPVLFDENDNMLEQETKDLIAKLYKDEAYEKLKPTDWKVVKQSETSEYSPEEYAQIKAERQGYRTICQEKIEELNSCKDLTKYKVEL